MRLNKYIASTTGLSRRAADKAIDWGRVKVNGQIATAGMQVTDNDKVTIDDLILTTQNSQLTTIMLNKPVGYICSRDGQGGQTIYELLPNNLHHLKPVGRLDKNSSGLLLLTNNGDLAHTLTHPSFNKTKIYKIALNRQLNLTDKIQIEKGIVLSDGLSKLDLQKINNDDSNWIVTMYEGRNRQIRRTFEALNYSVVKLHRTQFGNYKLLDLKTGNYKTI